MMLSLVLINKYTKIKISCKQKNIFSSNKKNHLVYIKGYNMVRNNFLAEITFEFDL